jgi:hypothetical protein
VSKRIEELERAHARLHVLVSSSVLVAMDSTASELLREAGATHGTVLITAEDLQHRATLALAHAKAELEVAKRAEVLNG